MTALGALGALGAIAAVAWMFGVLLFVGAMHNHERAIRDLTKQLQQSATCQVVANMRGSEQVTAAQQLVEALKNLRVTVGDRPRTH